jgi:alpha-beta hydrolase superfamily lysophospholipase
MTQDPAPGPDRTGTPGTRRALLASGMGAVACLGVVATRNTGGGADASEMGRSQDMGRAMERIVMEPDRFLLAGDDHRIPVNVWRAPDTGEQGCIVVGVHAFGDYRAAFAELAPLLNRHGHTLVAFDQRGFGATPARGAYAGHQTYRDDLALIVREARRSHGHGRPLVLLAESFGASVVLSALGREALDVLAIILSGPGVRENLPAKAWWDALISGARMVFGSGAIRLSQDSDALSERARERLRDDPLVLREIRADTYEQIVELADEASLAASRVRPRALVLYGEEDGIIAADSIAALMRRLGPDSTLRTYPGGPHLMLQARERAAMERDLLDFLEGLSARG